MEEEENAKAEEKTPKDASKVFLKAVSLMVDNFEIKCITKYNSVKMFRFKMQFFCYFIYSY